jgi:hypothetical protein
MLNMDTKNKIEDIKSGLGVVNEVVVKNFIIGTKCPIEAWLVYISSLTDGRIIENNILTPLMLYTNDSEFPESNLTGYICKKYLTLGETAAENNIDKIIDLINHGSSALLLENQEEIIVLNTSGGEFRSISDPDIESSVRGPREGFVEKLDINVGIIKRRVTDKNLVIEISEIGRRSKTGLALIYIKDIACSDVVARIRTAINAIDIDQAAGTGEIVQFIEKSPYSIFPQFLATERPDRIIAALMEGQTAIILDGTPFAIVCPTIFTQFFQSVENYYHRTLVAGAERIIRIQSAIALIFLPSIYLVLISHNVEYIPIKFLIPIYQSRLGIALPPLLEIVSMQLIVEFIREGGLRLPPKIASTLSIVGGIIIGNAAVDSKLASPSTLLIIGVSTVASFLIPNYEMAISLRLINFPMLLLADSLGFLGIAGGIFFLLVHLLSLENFGVDYLNIKRSDMKDMIVRAPIWKMNTRPEAIPSNDKVRQSDFRKAIKRKKDE